RDPSRPRSCPRRAPSAGGLARLHHVRVPPYSGCLTGRITVPLSGRLLITSYTNADTTLNGHADNAPHRRQRVKVNRSALWSRRNGVAEAASVACCPRAVAAGGTARADILGPGVSPSEGFDTCDNVQGVGADGGVSAGASCWRPAWRRSRRRRSPAGRWPARQSWSIPVTAGSTAVPPPVAGSRRS